jgi:hypothetical protein
MMAALQLRRMDETSTTYWRFFPAKAQSGEFGTIVQRLRDLGLKITMGTSTEPPRMPTVDMRKRQERL